MLASTRAKLKDGASVVILRETLSSSDKTSPYATRTRTSSVTDRRLITNFLRPVYSDTTQLNSTSSWVELCRYTLAFNRAVRSERSSCLSSNVHRRWVVDNKLAGPLKRPSPSTVASLHDITGNITSCYKSRRLRTCLRPLGLLNVV